MTYVQATAAAKYADKLAFGTRHNDWHLIDNKDRDYYTGSALWPHQARALTEPEAIQFCTRSTTK